MTEIAAPPASPEAILRRVPLTTTLRRAVRYGLLGGVVAILTGAIGMLVAFQGREVVIGIPLGHMLLLVFALAFGYLAASTPAPIEGVSASPARAGLIATGGVAGLVGGVVLSFFVLLASAVNLRPILRSVSPELVELLTFERSVGAAVLTLIVGSILLGMLGGALAALPLRIRRAALAALFWVLIVGLFEDLFVQLFRGLSIDGVGDVLFAGTGGVSVLGAVVVAVVGFLLSFLLGRGRQRIGERLAELEGRRRRTVMYIAVVVAIAVLAVLPQVVGVFFSEVLDLVGIFLLMGLGLNIVVGAAGMLDLGYVAFFAVGAYTTAVLTSPLSPQWAPELTFWVAIPFVLLAAALAGILVGTPVLRMRGDYLAIVTLGFGEIARLLFLSDWLTPYFGGAQGITQIPNLEVGGIEINTPTQFFYPILIFCLIAVYVSWALQDSRMGRAWMALREDEPVAEVMGINVVTAKLSAFVIGAMLAGLSGAIFATKIGSIFPNSFQILVSITVLVLIIVGGMGSIPGVVVGALLIVGIPNVLREFDQFRLLLFGVLLIYMMLKKPEGFIPSKRRARELHHEEVVQDAWLELTGATEGSPTSTPAKEV